MKFCTKCGSFIKYTRFGRLLILKCANCGYTETVELSEGIKPPSIEELSDFLRDEFNAVREELLIIGKPKGFNGYAERVSILPDPINRFIDLYVIWAEYGYITLEEVSVGDAISTRPSTQIELESEVLGEEATSIGIVVDKEELGDITKLYAAFIKNRGPPYKARFYLMGELHLLKIQYDILKKYGENLKTIYQKALEKRPITCTDPLECLLEGLRKRDVVAVYGPPGTGKTHLIAQASMRYDDKPILITSYTNVAVNNALERIRSLGGDLKMIRVGNPVKVSRELYNILAEDREKFDSEFILSHDVVGMTLAMLLILLHLEVLKIDPYNKPFKLAFIDEASMITIPYMFPAIMLSEKTVVVGDPHQLPPIANSNTDPITLLSLIYYINKDSMIKLRVQRRAHPKIMNWVNRLIYKGLLRHGKETLSYRIPEINTEKEIIRELLNPNRPIILAIHNMDSMWRRYGKSKSCANTLEAELAAEIAKTLKISRLSFAIISPYRLQTELIARILGEKAISAQDIYLSLESRSTRTIDAFQGRERDVVVLSLTASNNHRALQDYRRLNVAVTRAKSKLIVLSHVNLIYKNGLISELYEYVKKEGYILKIRDYAPRKAESVLKSIFKGVENYERRDKKILNELKRKRRFFRSLN